MRKSTSPSGRWLDEREGDQPSRCPGCIPSTLIIISTEGPTTGGESRSCALPPIQNPRRLVPLFHRRREYRYWLGSTVYRILRRHLTCLFLLLIGLASCRPTCPLEMLVRCPCSRKHWSRGVTGGYCH
ncbi:MAG: hypothetical protein FE78DRAFT_430624 [Acidomyces sp. 'richmondensis']|nr:MAG: hypothetical protein FE78DRAFT_430624 [Acidomyces sp. 'richmondensis']